MEPERLPLRPAIHQRAPALRTAGEGGVEMVGDVARGQGGAQAGGLERRLAVQRADPGAFLIAEHRRVQGAGDVVIGIFERRAHVDDVVEVIEPVQAGQQVFSKDGAIQKAMADFQHGGRVAAAPGALPDCRKGRWSRHGLPARPALGERGRRRRRRSGALKVSALVRSPIGFWPRAVMASSRAFRPSSVGRSNRRVARRRIEPVS